MGTHNDIIFRNLPGNLAGYYDQVTGLIHIDPTRSITTQRITLVHERFHKNLRHTPLIGAAHNAREIYVEVLTARRLISFQMLLGGIMCHTSLQELARMWDVDIGLAATRLGAITPIEHTLIEVCGRYCARRFVAPTDGTDSHAR